MADEQIHAKHRERIRERFLETGLKGFHPHEVLELLLYYAIPRKNTNPIGHELLRQFGRLDKVLSAEPEQLAKVKGMTPNAIVLFRLLRELYHYEITAENTGVSMKSGEKAGEFFKALYLLEQNEVIRAAFLDNQLNLMQCVTISEGHPTAGVLSVRQLTEAALFHSCDLLILAHNHPNGRAEASAEDISTTRYLVQALKQNGIQLVDHIIVSGDAYLSLRECGAFVGMF